MERKIKVTTHEQQEAEDRAYMRSLTPEERLSLLEQLHIEGGRFLYDYPSRLQRVVTVRKAPARK